MELVASFEEAAFADTAGIHGLFFEVANNFIWRFGHVSGHVQQFSKKSTVQQVQLLAFPVNVQLHLPFFRRGSTYYLVEIMATVRYFMWLIDR